MGRIHVDVRDEPLSCDAALAFLNSPGHGAVCVFVGKVRDTNEDKPVRAVTYDAHDALARHTFQEICADVQRRWGDNLDVWLEHFKGRLEVGGASVIIAVGSGHRAESFEACRYVIEQVKRRSPIWKQEHYLDGEDVWIAGHSLRDAASSLTAATPKTE